MLMSGEDRNRGAASALKTTRQGSGAQPVARPGGDPDNGLCGTKAPLETHQGVHNDMQGQDTGTSGGDAGEVWARVKRRLRAELGEDVYTSWFARLELTACEAGCARLSVPTRFLKSWIEAHYHDRVLAIYRAEDSRIERLALSVRGAMMREPASQRRAHADAQSPAATQPASGHADTVRMPLTEGRDARTPAAAGRVGFLDGDDARSGRHAASAERGASPARGSETDAAVDIAGAPLDQRLTFENFAIGRSNALAHAAGDRVARHEGSALYNPLFVHAGVGLGKTHLLHAVGHEARGLGKRVIYLTADRFMYGFVASLKAQTSHAFKEKLRGIDLLILDDVQFIQGRTIQQEFGHTLNALIDAGRQVVIAADRPPSDLESLDERARSRLAGGLVVEVGSLDEELRIKILTTRIAAVRAEHAGFDVSDDVIAYVARHVTTNGRDLEGAVNRLLAHATLTGAAVTLDTAENAIRDLVRNREPKRVKIEDIQKLVASRYNVSRSDILSERRTAAVVRPRQIAMYLSKSLTLRSLPEIGRRFGGRDHTTVLHAVRKIEKALGEDAAMSEEVELLKRMLQD
ncbi:MAG: chromosomal replication initiator protein DnaA [Saliniramus fredricksonii]|uniref:Chromosomal replication initiator protein DnaA n=2 Tax=Saliniramus fredricksonii TaxID=1653334 RepID=A0A0P8A3Z6_9HYPH|nr:MAG: chromosomal replication initiator protein DnaA [Saliniramus fredricksonii]SCC80834.1 chromosomal replication initiator protein [Saliniramus fredricksonii]